MATRSPLVLSTALMLIAAIGVSGCGSSATTSTATSPSAVSRCAVTVNGDGQVPAAGATKRFTVSAARECAWSASVEAAWLAIRAGASGQGDGTVEVAASANPDPQVRRGSVVLNEQRVEVMQAAAECTFSLSEPSGTFPQAGGSGSFDVRSSSSLCTWTASSDSPWIVVRTATGKGNAEVAFDVAASPGVARTGTITAAGHRFIVSQDPAAAVACSYVAAPRAHTVPTTGGVVSVAVTTAPQCSWAVASSANWIAVAGPASFSGPGTATFNVAPVAGAGRTGIVVVAGQPVTISQGGACAFAISPEVATLPAAGGSGQISVSTADGCPWSVTSNAPWLQISGGASYTGSGTVQYQVAATTESRSGTVTIAGRTFTLNQGAPAPPPPPPPACAYALSSGGQAVPAGGGAGSVVLTTAADCPWSASSNAPWLTVTSAASGSGTATIAFSVAPQAGAERTGALTIGGQTFTVTQSSACSFAIAPEQHSAGSGGGVTTIAVIAPAGCAWSSSSQTSWLTLRALGPENGSGSVEVTIGGNTSAAARVGTATIAGRTLTVTQAAPCAFKLKPQERTVSSESDIAKIDVDTTPGCSWSATSTVTWIVVGSGAIGTGDGEVWILFTRNTGDERVGTVIIGGQTFTLTQKRERDG